jgi:predicted RNase H-like HicB family nuclease
MGSPSTAPTHIPVSYRALVHPEEEGGYWAEIPDLPGCFTQGDTLDEIYHNLAEAIASHLDLDPEAVRVGLLEIANA